VTETSGSPRLTTDLLAPLGPFAPDHGAAVLQAAERIPSALADLAVPRPGGRSLRLTDHEVRVALAAPDHGAPPTPFAWSARTARRALGLAALRALVAGQARTPTEGVRLTLAQALQAVQAGDRTPSPMDRWLAGLPKAGLALVQAEAVTWATRVWCALDWSSFGEPPVIGRDHWWNSPHSSLLAIRSRAEVRSVAPNRLGNPFSVHLVVLGGPRRPTIRSELSVVAMVEALHAPRSLPPGRIVGWWPDSGHVVKVEIDRAVLETGLSAVAQTLGRVEALPVPSERATRAAA
jgi:hypothetical protein